MVREKIRPMSNRRQNDRKSCQNELAALLIEMIEDVARCSRCIDDTRHVVIDDHGHRREHVHADAAADRVDRRRRLVGFANSQGRSVLPLHRRGHFLDMGERLADLIAAGDYDAAGIEDPESGERDLLRFQNDRHQPRADLDIRWRRRRARRKRIGPSPQQVGAGSEIECGPDRR